MLLAVIKLVHFYRQDALSADLPVLYVILDHGPIFLFFAPQRRHVAPIKVKFGRKEPYFTLIGSGMWVYGPQNLKIWNFTNIIAPIRGGPLARFLQNL